MHLGYTIVYVPDVPAALDFWERAFDLRRRFLSEEGTYGELDTGDTTLGFSAYGNAAELFAGGVRPHTPDGPPAPVEIGFTTDDVASAYDRALAAGASGIAGPKQQPWGQTTAFLRDPAGILIELGTPVG